MMLGPFSAPSSPPETPTPRKRSPRSAIALSRRWVSRKCELPPSTIVSPSSSSGASSSITASTAGPAFTMVMIVRGRSSACTNSSVVPLDVIGPSEPCSAMNCSVLDAVRLCTAIGMSWWATLRARLAPITARPVRPNRGPLMARRLVRRVPRIDTAPLGPLTVTRLCLGAMLMGDSTPVDEAHRMLDRYLDAGDNFLDTADTYGDGGSERTLAPWLADHRDEVVLASKVRFEVSDPPGSGLAPDRIRAACDASLQRLGVDVIDLYQVHAPDPDVPLEDTLEALDGLVRAGKVRALGASNYPAWLLAWAVATQDRNGWAPFISLQPQYSLVERTAEIELLPFCRAAGLGVIPWGPLGPGFLPGTYEPDTQPRAGSRMADASDDLEEAFHRRAIERNFRVVDEAREIAGRRGATIAQVAIAWLLGTEGVTAPIVGARTYEQLEDLLPAAELTLTPEERARLERHAPPPDVYPQRMLIQQSGLPERISLPLSRAR